MSAQYHIDLTMWTAEGPHPVARFYLGSDPEHARYIFRQLHGVAVTGPVSITLDLLETVDGLPLSVEMIGCSLEQLGQNCQLITKEVFKHHAL